jgi:Fe-S-cluster containining protein
MVQLDQNAIPCDGCTHCCESDQVVLRPEAGDDLSQYDFEFIDSALYPGQLTPVLKSDPKTGYCIYLRAGGCSIHAKRPSVCRRFHCARTAKALEELAPAIQAALHRRGDVFDQALLDKGRERLAYARREGLAHLLDTDMQRAAFERIAAMPAPKAK